MEEERLKQIELDWNKATETNDVDSMANYMSDERVIFSGDGQITTKLAVQTMLAPATN